MTLHPYGSNHTDRPYRTWGFCGGSFGHGVPKPVSFGVYPLSARVRASARVQNGVSPFVRRACMCVRACMWRLIFFPCWWRWRWWLPRGRRSAGASWGECISHGVPARKRGTWNYTPREELREREREAPGRGGAPSPSCWPPDCSRRRRRR